MLPSALGSRDTSDSTMPAVNRSKFAVSVTVPVRADAVISSASLAFSDRNGPSRGTRSEERRGGKEGVSTSRSRGSPYRYKTKTNRAHNEHDCIKTTQKQESK